MTDDNVFARMRGEAEKRGSLARGDALFLIGTVESLQDQLIELQDRRERDEELFGHVAAILADNARPTDFDRRIADRVASRLELAAAPKAEDPPARAAIRVLLRRSAAIRRPFDLPGEADA